MTYSAFGAAFAASIFTRAASYLKQCLVSANWYVIGAVLLVGAFLTFCLIRKHTLATRTLVFDSVLCTLMLAVAYFLRFSPMVYVVYGVILVLVILYQPELREVFLRGTRSLLSSNKHVTTTLDRKKMIDTVCQTTMELSRTKTGALIVIERRIKLNEIAEKGVAIDAQVNSLLIRNLFYDKAPLHDGALLIRDCRICAAACILPLTSRTDMDPTLGTRHRAAMGLCEVSDAVVIVVSEETGVVSVAHDSKLTREYSFQSLHAFLAKTLLQGEEGQKSK